MLCKKLHHAAFRCKDAKATVALEGMRIIVELRLLSRAD